MEEKDGFYWREDNFHQTFSKLTLKDPERLAMLSQLRLSINSMIGADEISKSDLVKEGPFRRLFIALVYADSKSCAVRFFLFLFQIKSCVFFQNFLFILNDLTVLVLL
jgi:hypothetical protein